VRYRGIDAKEVHADSPAAELLWTVGWDSSFRLLQLSRIPRRKRIKGAFYRALVKPLKAPARSVIQQWGAGRRAMLR
jgi:hypothetical protein